MLTDRKARKAAFNNKCADFFTLPSFFINNRSGYCDNNKNIRISGICDKDFTTIQNPVIAVKDCNRLLSLRVRSRTRLSQTECSEFFTGGKVGQILLFLRFGAVVHDGIDAQRCVS